MIKQLITVIFIMISVICVSSVYSSSVRISDYKPVSASSYYSTYVPSNLTDLTQSTGWNAGGFSGWATIDLQSMFTSINRVIFYSNAYPSSSETFTLYIDNQYIDAKTVYIQTGTYTPVQFDFAEVTGRYVKMSITSAESWVAGREFEVYRQETIPEPATVILLGLSVLGIRFFKKNTR